MLRSLRLVFASLSLLTLACGDTPTPAPQDLRPPADLTFLSACGHPGDKGNSLGVGQFCENLSDCADNTRAKLCTTLGDPDNFFCTFACKKDGPVDQCGESARCACSSGGCGCFPTRCDEPSDGGVSDGGAGG